MDTCDTATTPNTTPTRCMPPIMQRFSPQSSPAKRQTTMTTSLHSSAHFSPVKSSTLQWQFYSPGGKAIAPKPYTIPTPVPAQEQEQTSNPSMSELMDTLMAAPAFPKDDEKESENFKCVVKPVKTMRDIEADLRESNKVALAQHVQTASRKHKVDKVDEADQVQTKETALVDQKTTTEPVCATQLDATAALPFFREARIKAAHTATVVITTVRDIEAGLRQAFSDVRKYAAVIRLPSRHYGAECGLVVEKLDMTHPDDHFRNTELQLVKSDSEWSTFPCNLSSEIRNIVWQQVLNPPKTTHVLTTKLPGGWSFNLDDCPTWTRMPHSQQEVFLAEYNSSYHIPLYAEAVAKRLQSVVDLDAKFSRERHLFKQTCHGIEEPMQDEIQKEVARMNKGFPVAFVWSTSFGDKIALVPGWFAKLEYLLLQSASSQYGSYEMQCILAAATNLLGPETMAALCLYRAGPNPRITEWSSKQNAYNAWMGAVSMLVVLQKSRPREEPIHNLSSMVHWVVRACRDKGVPPL